MSTIDESGAGMADSDINSTHADGAGNPGQGGGRSTAEAASGEDAARGNLDGSTAVNEPRDRALDEAGGNGSFDTGDTGAPHPDGSVSDAGESGQDNGLAE
jgi:hypothetical protein